MRKVALITVFTLLLSFQGFSWGPRGHRLVAEVAKNFIDKSVLDSVTYYLDEYSFEDAATWMDEVMGNANYDFMKPWHIVLFPADKTYVRGTSPELMNVLENLIVKLRAKKNMNKKDMQLSLKILFHLVADVHQPLHCGYPKDNGGTNAKVRFHFKASNLHEVWDSEILEFKAVGQEECLKLANSLLKTDITNMQNAPARKWMEESRGLLPIVYGYKNDKIDDEYIEKNARIIKMQIIKSGIRLAGVLNQVFGKNKA